MAQLPYLPELIARKRAGLEQSSLVAADVAFHQEEYTRLRRALEEASQTTGLPDGPPPAAKAVLHDLPFRVRLGQ